LTIDMVNSARTVKLAGNLTIGANFTTDTNAISLVTSGSTSVTLPTTGTLATLAGTEVLTNKTLNDTVTTFQNTTTTSTVKLDLSTVGGTGLQIGNLTITNGVVQSTPFSVVAGGYGYAVGDRVTLNGNATGSGAKFQITTVTATGAVTAISWIAGGTGYVPTSGTATAQTLNTSMSTTTGEVALRTYSLPSSDGADTLVTQDATQTLTNKTLTTPTIGTSMIVPIIYGSNLASGTLTLRSTSSGT